jgi:hypothetical protein
MSVASRSSMCYKLTVKFGLLLIRSTSSEIHTSEQNCGKQNKKASTTETEAVQLNLLMFTMTDAPREL